MNNNGLEIEHKYLIRYPNRDMLLQMPGAGSVMIEQTYLEAPRGFTERVRRWERDGQVMLFHTVKSRISALSHTEVESEIGEEEYRELLSRRLRGSSVISKERIMIPYGGHTVEIDIYPFWDDRAVAEVEVMSEDEEVTLPDYIEVIREVTDDGRYKNISLAFDHSFPV